MTFNSLHCPDTKLKASFILTEKLYSSIKGYKSPWNTLYIVSIIHEGYKSPWNTLYIVYFIHEAAKLIQLI